jgi:HK97 family phage major capsid protein
MTNERTPSPKTDISTLQALLSTPDSPPPFRKALMPQIDVAALAARPVPRAIRSSVRCETKPPASLEALAASFEAHNSAVTALASNVAEMSKDIDRLSESLAAASIGGDATRDPAKGRGANALATERAAIAAFAKGGGAGEFRAQAGMSVDSDPDGGVWAMPTMSDAITRKLFDGAAMPRLARTVVITSGDGFTEPLDIGEAGASWAGERQTRDLTSSPTVGMLNIPLHEIDALLPVTQKLLDTANFDLGAWVEDKISDKFTRTIGAALLSGDGINKPRGLLAAPQSTAADAARPWGTLQTIKSGDANGFPTSGPADCLKNLVWGLRAPYRNGAAWLMSSLTMAAIDQMKDSTGQYLLRPGLTAGAPTTLLGYPIEIDETMPDVGANATPIAFGNFRLGYTMIRSPGLKFLRDPYSSKPHVLFYAYQRIGGGIANSEAIKLLKVQS